MTAAPARATPKKRAVKKPERRNDVRVIKSELVGVRSLNLYHDNPNVRDIEDHKASLLAHGQFRSVVVNMGTHASYEKEVLAGNHTVEAARQLGWTKVRVDWVDVDDGTARKIVLADNKISQGIEIDDESLRRLLAGLDDFTGTGYSPGDLDALNEQLGTATAELEEQLAAERKKQGQDGDDSDGFDDSSADEDFDPLMDADIGDKDDTDGESAGEFDGNPDSDDISDDETDLPGVFTLKTPNEIDFGTGLTYWGIPKLTNNLVRPKQMPTKLEPWCGTFSRKSPQNQDPDQWWLWNWGTDNTNGMNSFEQCIVAFYAFDDHFENWWWYPDRYVKKLLVSKIPMVVTPDWSMERAMPRAECLWQLYRSRFIGRYIQECGIPVIPNVAWIDGDIEFLEKYVLATLPKKLPMICIQMQTIDLQKVTGGIENYKNQVEMVFQTLKPEAALIYGSELGRNLVQTVNTGDTDLIMMRTRLEAIEEHTEAEGGRKRKATI